MHERDGSGIQSVGYVYVLSVERRLERERRSRTGAPCNKGVGDVGTGPNSRTEQNRERGWAAAGRLTRDGREVALEVAARPVSYPLACYVTMKYQTQYVYIMTIE